MLSVGHVSCVLNSVFGPDLNKQEPSAALESKKQIRQKAMSIRIPFIENQGQIAGDQVRYYAKTFGGSVYVTQHGELIYSFSGSDSKDKTTGRSSTPENIRSVIVKESLVDKFVTSPQSNDPSQAKVNYFIGNDQSKWITNIPTYNSISLGEVYKGIDLSIKAYGKTVEKIFTVQPGGDPLAIRLKLEGSNSIKINENGELEFETGLGVFNFSRPIAYQEKEGEQVRVQVAYYIDMDGYGFLAGNYDKSLPLIIDPVLTYSTYLGGTYDDEGFAIAVDSSGNAYVTGETWSMETGPIGFPTFNAFQSNHAGAYDVFVSKLNSDGSALIYSTFFGGLDRDHGRAIAVDSSENVYVAGETMSVGFPTTANAYQSGNSSGGYDAFLTKFNSDGSALLYSTYFGGASGAAGNGIAVDPSGNAYVTGWTYSADLPMVNAYQSTFGGSSDVFVAKFDPSQAIGADTLVYSTYLGGAGQDRGYGIAVDDAGMAYVTGSTASSVSTGGFPTANPYQADNASSWASDVFLAKLDPAQSGAASLLYATYLGGTGEEVGTGIAVDAAGITYVTGYTSSTVLDGGFPTVSPYQADNAGGDDVFIAKLDPSQSGAASLIYSTYLGGTDDDQATGIAVDGEDNVYVTGWTYSAGTPGGFPIENEFQSDNAGYTDVFVTKMNSDGSALLFSTYLGGTDDEEANGIAVDDGGNVYVAGTTWSSGDPTGFPTENPYQSDNAGGKDVFVAKLSEIVDTDADGLPDDWEIMHFGDLSRDGTDDLDVGGGDGLTDLEEFLNGTDPNNPDSDGDRLPDGWEVDNGLDALSDDAQDDPDGDGLTNSAEYQMSISGLHADGSTVALYKFEEAAPGPCLDSSGNGNDATAIGTKVVTEAFGRARQLNGVNELINMDAVRVALQNTPAFTLEYLAKAPPGSSAAPPLVCHDCDNGWQLVPMGSAMQYGIKTSDRAGYCYWSFLSGSSVAGSPPHPTIPYTDKDWHHYAFTWNGTLVTVYRDGALITSHPAGGSFVQDGNHRHDAAIGYADFDGTYYAGTVDEVRVSNTAIGGADIQNTWQALWVQSRWPVVTRQVTTLDPKIADTDGDGLTDGHEVNIAHTNPFHADSDGDGTPDDADNCPTMFNQDQNDADTNGVGDLCQDLTALYTLDGNAWDSSGSENHGIAYNGVTFPVAGIDRAGSFDGIDDRVKIPEHMLFGTDVSLNLWLKTADTTFGLVSGANATWADEYLLYYDSGQLGLYFHHSTGLPSHTVDINLNDDRWHMLTVATRTDAADIYLDGVLLEATTYGSGGGFSVEGLWVAADQDSVNGDFQDFQHFAGMLDEFKLYNRALTEPEVLAIYTSADSDSDGLTDFWEINWFGDILSSDGTGDADGDLLLDAEEFQHRTNPTNSDTDGDGVTDKQEIDNGSDPLDGTWVPSNTWTGTLSADWHTGGNWSSGSVPTDGMDIVIPFGTPSVIFNTGVTTLNSLASDGDLTITTGGTLNIAAASTVSPTGEITVSGGGFGGDGDLAVSGSFLWTGGSLTGAGNIHINDEAEFLISGVTAKLLDQKTINANVMATWTGTGSITASNGATLNNTGDFFIDVDGDVHVFGDPGATPLINNSGTLAKRLGSGTVTFNDCSFNSTGAIDIQAGAFSLNTQSSTIGGSVAIAAGTNLQLRGSNATHTHHLEDGLTCSGTGDMVLNGGTVVVHAGVAVENVIQNGADLEGTGTLTVNGSMQWSSGQIRGGGSIVIAPGTGSLTILGASSKILDTRTIDNLGTIFWTEAGWLLPSNGARIDNQGIFEIQNDAVFSGSGTPLPVIDNTGTIVKTDGIGQTLFDLCDLTSTGTIRTSSGTLVLSSRDTAISGPLDVQVNTTLAFGGAIGSNTHVFNPGTVLTGTGTIRFAGGNISADVDLAIPCQVELSIAANLGGTGNITLQHTSLWSGGTMSGSGTTRVNPGVELTLNSNSSKTLDGRTLVNAGTIQWDEAGWIFGNNGGAVTNTGAFYLNGSGTFVGDVGVQPVFTNDGTVAQLDPSGDSTFSNGRFVNNGTLQIDNGIVMFTGAELANSPSGVIQGRATLHVGNGTFENQGTVNPGTSPGILTITGNYPQSSSGVLNIEIGGTDTVLSEYDQLVVGGNAALAGTLNVILANSFVPEAGNHFEILSYADHSGQFDAENLPGLGSNLEWVMDYGPTTIALDVIDSATQDGDGDGLPDAWEQQIVDADPSDGIATVADVLPGDDFDGDGLSNQQELANGTNPVDPDSDDDRVSDGDEIANGTIPTDPLSFTPSGTGAISGILKMESGDPITGVQIQVEAINGDPCGNWGDQVSVQTNSTSGTYSITGLVPGNYYLRTYNMNQSDYVNEWWTGGSPDSSDLDCSSAQLVTVSADSLVLDTDFNLESGGSLSGQVLDENSDPIEGLWMHAFTAACGGNWLGGDHTDDKGDFTISGLPAGTVYLQTCADCVGFNFVDEWWDGAGGAIDCNGAAGINVTVGGNSGGNDFQLEPGGSISGIVTRDSDGQPIGGIIFDVWDYVTGDHQGAFPNETDGTYVITGLTSGSYRVLARAQGTQYASEYYDDAFNWDDAASISVTPGQTNAGVDFSLGPGGSLSGRVIRDSDGQPIHGIWVSANGYLNNTYFGGVSTESDGTYTLDGLLPGDYRIEVTDWNYLYLWEIFDDAYNYSEADPVSVTVGTNTPGIDFSLAVDTDGDNLSDAWEQQIVDADPTDGITSIEDVLPGDDFDNDGLNNSGEYDNATDPNDPDSDDDRVSDGDEIANGTIPTDPSPLPRPEPAR